MSVGTADLHTAIAAAWDAAGLDAAFQALQPAGTDADRWPILNDAEAAPGQGSAPPYCVVEFERPRRLAGMTSVHGAAGSHREVREHVLRFNVHAGPSGVKSAKQVASELAAEIMEAFGGHPTAAPTAEPTLTSGNVLALRCEADWGVRTDEDRWQWVVEYSVKVDVPVTV